MPELPEVETVCRGLAPLLQKQTITNVILNRSSLRKPFPADMQTKLIGSSIREVRRRSKYLLVTLSNSYTMIIHLGMSGRILTSAMAQNPSATSQNAFHHPTSNNPKHNHVIFELGNKTRVIYNDPRRFGLIDVIPSETLSTCSLLNNLGPEPLGNTFNETYLSHALARSERPIKLALLDQRLVAGLGNIYVCESLYHARISPLEISSQVSAQKIPLLVHTIRDVLTRAIDAGGSSLRDFHHSDGSLGYFQYNFQVYAQEGKACQTTDCKEKIIRITQSGRSSFYCPICQALQIAQ